MANPALSCKLSALCPLLREFPAETRLLVEPDGEGPRLVADLFLRPKRFRFAVPPVGVAGDDESDRGGLVGGCGCWSVDIGGDIASG